MNAGIAPGRRLLALAAVALVGFATGSAGQVAATLVLVGGVGVRSDGIAGLLGWIVGGAILGGALGYAADGLVTLPLATAGSVGLGIALGGGFGGIFHLLSTEDPATAEDEHVTVDMAGESAREPTPPDLFDEHPDPLLYVTDAGGGPVVRAANDGYERAFDLPAATIEGAPLADVLVVADGAKEGVEAIVDRVADGEGIDAVVSFETPEGERPYRVRTVVETGNGYLLFTPVNVTHVDDGQT